jgi:hypothetical protein
VTLLRTVREKDIYILVTLKFCLYLYAFRFIYYSFIIRLQLQFNMFIYRNRRNYGRHLLNIYIICLSPSVMILTGFQELARVVVH